MEKRTPFIKMDNISMWYPHKVGLSRLGRENLWVKAVDQVSLEMKAGEVLGIIGESGCGKSTLGRVLAGIERPTGGDMLINGQSSLAMIQKNNKEFRRTVQIVFQNPFDTFTPRDTIEQILMRTLKLHGIGDNYEERRQTCLDTLASSGLRPPEDIMKRYPHELSGGQLQRISILRAMLLGPRFIVADEPVSMLDVSVRAVIINMLLDLSRKREAAVVFISHDILLTRYVSEKVAVMYLGRVVEYGATDTVIHTPKHPYTQALISNSPSIDKGGHQTKIKVTGEPPTPINPGPGCYFAPRCPRADGQCRSSYPETVEIGPGHRAACFHME